ncbi:oligosaccharide flippase family protein, partial [Enterococcus faecium]|nr:oligosaccharide flippase family protein [Enterococcus faecium]
MKNIARNFFYQSLFQVTKIIIPIITIPIVSNALGPSGIGIYNYTLSIAQYFVLIAGLGVAIYGNRE